MFRGRSPALARLKPLHNNACSRDAARDCAFALLYIAAAPLLLFAVMLIMLSSKLALPTFGADPAGELAESHPEAWTLLTLTGRCTLGLILFSLLFWDTI